MALLRKLRHLAHAAVLLPVLPRSRLRRVVPLVPVDGPEPSAVEQALRREVEELRAELAAVRAWCEGLEDEQALLWQSQRVARATSVPEPGTLLDWLADQLPVDGGQDLPPTVPEPESASAASRTVIGTRAPASSAVSWPSSR